MTIVNRPAYKAPRLPGAYGLLENRECRGAKPFCREFESVPQAFAVSFPPFRAGKEARGMVEEWPQRPPGSCQDSRTVETSQLEASLSRRIQDAGGPDLSRCYQCLTCTLGCPIVSEMDYQPHALVRMAQLGLRKQVLSSRTIWLCAGCETCATRCPNDIQIVKLMDTLRQMALREGFRPAEPAVAAFHRTFLAGIQRWGRQYELGMMLALKLRTLDLFSDIRLGLKMLLKGKLALLPHRSHVSKDIKAIFRRKEEG